MLTHFVLILWLDKIKFWEGIFLKIKKKNWKGKKQTKEENCFVGSYIKRSAYIGFPNTHFDILCWCWNVNCEVPGKSKAKQSLNKLIVLVSHSASWWDFFSFSDHRISFLMSPRAYLILCWRVGSFIFHFIIYENNGILKCEA
jgi:hypothetical protein